MSRIAHYFSAVSRLIITPNAGSAPASVLGGLATGGGGPPNGALVWNGTSNTIVWNGNTITWA